MNLGNVCVKQVYFQKSLARLPYSESQKIFGRIFRFSDFWKFLENWHHWKLVWFPALPLGGTSIFKSSTVSTNIWYLVVSYGTGNAKKFKMAVWTIHICRTPSLVIFSRNLMHSIIIVFSAKYLLYVWFYEFDWTLLLWLWFHDHGVWANTKKIPKFRQNLTEVYKFSDLKHW